MAMLDQYRATGAMPDLPDDHHRNMTDIWRRLATVSVDVFGGRILDQGKALGLVAETKDINAEFFLRLVEDFIADEMLRQRITSITRVTRVSIINQILAGQTDGLGIEAIARNIETALPSKSRTRAALIARTETHGASNYASDQAADALGLDMQKEWIAVEDERTRGVDPADEFSHIAMNSADPVDKGQPFQVPDKYGGFEELMYPGDLSGSAGNIINCRCVVGYIVKE